MRTTALHGDLPETYRERWGPGTLFKPNPGLASARVIANRPGGACVRPARGHWLSGTRSSGRLRGRDFRRASLISVPMLKDKRVVGTIAIYRRKCVRSPTSRSNWCTNFAAQAVIAIENTRLLSELPTPESLQQQTATAEVLKIISSSPGESGAGV